MKRSEKTWIQTFTGKQFWPLSPDPDDIDIIDIAHALSNVCRFTGHSYDFYSVAQHCVFVSQHVGAVSENPNDTLWGLLHDAPEAYLCDVASPVKHAPGEFGKLYREYEKVLMDCICVKFGLPLEEPEIVRAVDARMLATERRDLMAAPPRAWPLLNRVVPYKHRIRALSPGPAERYFLDHFSVAKFKLDEYNELPLLL
jgi:hypothetical protein